MDYSLPGTSAHGDSPGKNIGVGCYALLQGIFLTQKSNLCLMRLLHCWEILYCWASREAQGMVQFSNLGLISQAQIPSGLTQAIKLSEPI